jgi:hypothetical protein
MSKGFLLALVLACGPLQAQDSLSLPAASPEVSLWTPRRIIATGLVGGILAGSLVSSYYDWWKDDAQPFHFTDDGLFENYSLGMDKLGHTYTSYFYFHTFHNVMLWGGYDRSAALWWSAGTTAFFALSIELGDAVSPYGFSFADLGFNMIGLGYGMLQTEIPFLKNFSLKWSYVPADGYRWPPRFTDHYDAHTYWLAVNIHQLLPEGARTYWPGWLQLAVGYGVDETQTRREWVIGLDLNLGAFQVEQPDLRLLLQTADLFHFPAPAVKFTQGEKPEYSLFYTN